MTQIVLDDRRWRKSLRALGRAGVPVVHVSGARDALAPPSVVPDLGEDGQALTTAVHPTADHLLPLDHPEWCVELLRATLRDRAHLARDIPRRS